MLTYKKAKENKEAIPKTSCDLCLEWERCRNNLLPQCSPNNSDDENDNENDDGNEFNAMEPNLGYKNSEENHAEV